MKKIRPAAVAGTFYPGNPRQLRAQVERFLDEAKAPPPLGGRVRAIIAPHAGYIYSGPVAGSAYACLRQSAYRRVILVGPAHFVPVSGLAGSQADAFATPLGQVPLDREAMERLAELPQVRLYDPAHAPEHSLEVQLPFLQVLWPEFSLVPLVAGMALPAQVAAVLEPFWDDEESCLVISSDLSHYHDYATACRLDLEAARSIEELKPLARDQACGQLAINGLLSLAQAHGWQATTLDLRNSGDTAGPKERVVGYGAFAFTRQ